MDVPISAWGFSFPTVPACIPLLGSVAQAGRKDGKGTWRLENGAPQAGLFRKGVLGCRGGVRNALLLRLITLLQLAGCVTGRC